MRYALVVGGVVVNVVEQASLPTVPGQWVACGNAGPGWTYSNSTFAAPADTRPRHITGYALKMRMTSAERIAIRAAAASSDEVADFMDLADSAQYIDLDDPTTRTGVQTMEAVLLLGTGRALEILDAAIVDAERP